MNGVAMYRAAMYGVAINGVDINGAAFAPETTLFPPSPRRGREVGGEGALCKATILTCVFLQKNDEALAFHSQLPPHPRPLSRGGERGVGEATANDPLNDPLKDPLHLTTTRGAWT
jgi:hypothetical protein